MNKPKRPRRQKKGDRLLNPGAHMAEIRCDHAVAPFDERAREMEVKWGIDRLPGLVSTEMAERYGSAIAKLNAAIDSRDPEQVKIRADVCVRGLAAMDAAAEAAGHPKADPGIVEYEHDGWKFGIMVDARMWQAKPKALYPVFSLSEVARALKERGADHPLLEEAKLNLPGSEVTNWGNSELEDEIPF